jgi:hypothetical protein
MRGLLQGRCLDVEVGERSVEAAWQPPGLLAEQREHGGDERHPHDERVDEDADAEAEAMVFKVASWVPTKLAKTESMINAAAVTIRVA